MKYNEQILVSNFEQYKSTRVSQSDIEHSKIILSKESYYNTKQQQDIVTKYTYLKYKSKLSNTVILITRVDYTSLLLSQV